MTLLRAVAPWAGFWLAVAASCDVSAAYEPSDITKVVLLGTGTPNTDPARSGPATAIIVNEVPYLIDFGPGVVRRAAAARRKHDLEALAESNLRVVFATHLHSDHTVGYPDLIFTTWVLDRTVPLEVYGPTGIEAMTGHVLAAWAADIRIRVDGLEPRDDTGWRVRAHDIEPGVVYRDDNISVEAFRVCHGGIDDAYGYKLTTPDRVIVLSGDTSFCPVIIDKARGADILLHEAYNVAGWNRRKPEWKTYHAAFHTSSHDLARIANATRPGLLILYHQLFMDGFSAADLLKEITDRYDGPVVSGKDLEVY